MPLVAPKWFAVSLLFDFSDLLELRHYQSPTNLSPMFSKKVLALILASIVILTGCAEVSDILPEKKATSVLSGREGIDGQLLVVKVDDTNAAHPQIGLEDADIVYIEQVEAGLTRLAAIYSTVIPQRVGPVRSARISDIELLSQYGRVAFAYSGAQRKLLPVIAAANLQDLGAQRQSPTIYTTDPSRVSPFAMVLRADLLMQKIKENNLSVDIAKSVGFSEIYLMAEKPLRKLQSVGPLQIILRNGRKRNHAGIYPITAS
jgi:hypothetical protein